MKKTGRVYDNTGAAEVGLAVTVKNISGGGTLGSDTTDSSGEWSVTGLSDANSTYVEIVDGANKYVIWGDIDVEVRNIRADIRHTPTPTAVTISAGGAAAITLDYHTLTSNSGSSDDVATITGGYTGQEVVFEPTSGHTITFTHNGAGTANTISCKQDRTIAGDDLICLKFNGTYWKMCWLGDNS